MTTAGRTGYREVLALPGVTPLMTLSLLARVPASAAAITLTLHVVLTLDLGYAAAGAVGAASTVGMAIGAPVLGRLVDRRGLRPMLAVTTAAAAVFWAVAPHLAYPALLVGAFLGGLLAFPVYSIIRQALASAVPPDRRRPAAATTVVGAGLVNAVWCAASLAGGFLHGTARRSWAQATLVAALSVATLLVALGDVWWSFALLLVPAGMLTAPALAAGSERVSVLAPEPARGVVTGLHGSATTLGAAAGTPLAGLLIDVASPATAIVVVAATGAALAGVAAALAGVAAALAGR